MLKPGRPNPAVPGWPARIRHPHLPAFVSRVQSKPRVLAALGPARLGANLIIEPA